MHCQDTVDDCNGRNFRYKKRMPNVTQSRCEYHFYSQANLDCKGVLVQHRCSRSSRILRDVNGKEHPDLGKSDISKTRPRTFWVTGKLLSEEIFQFVITEEGRGGGFIYFFFLYFLKQFNSINFIHILGLCSLGIETIKSLTCLWFDTCLVGIASTPVYQWVQYHNRH